MHIIKDSVKVEVNGCSQFESVDYTLNEMTWRVIVDHKSKVKSGKNWELGLVFWVASASQ